MKRVAIIGAGPAGLTAAYQLAAKGFHVEIFEAAPYVGGMARSFPLWDAIVDIGPHRFLSSDPKVSQLWYGLAGEDYKMVERLTRILYRGCFFAYPLRPLDVLRNLGLTEAVRCALSYVRQLFTNKKMDLPARSFEDWVVRAFGRRLYEVFFKDYSEKLWGIPCSELDADFAAQRIQRFSLGSAVLSAFGLEKRMHKTLVHRFPHPLQGAGIIYERMAEKIREMGGIIHLGRPVVGLSEMTPGLCFPDGTTQAFDHVVSTMPLTQLCLALPGLPTSIRESVGCLTYRNTILVYLKIGRPDLFPDQWLYVQSPELRFGRLTNFRNWPSGFPAGKDHSILAMEYWCDDGDERWKSSDGELIRLGIEELVSTGLLGGAPVLDSLVLRVPKCYPVYRKGYRTWLDPITQHLKSHYAHLTLIGRYGTFKYNNQDHSILMGILAAENIAGEANHDLWAINTDYEKYQEGSCNHSSCTVTSSESRESRT